MTSNELYQVAIAIVLGADAAKAICDSVIAVIEGKFGTAVFDGGASFGFATMAYYAWGAQFV